MKHNLLFSLVAIFAFIGCSVDPLEDEVYQSNITDVNSEIDDDFGCAGPDNSRTITYSEAAAIESWDEVRKLYMNLLGSQVPRNGTFDPSIWSIIRDFQNRGLGEYSTVYSLNGDCTDSVRLTVIVVEDPVVEDPICSLSAGKDNSITITEAEARALPSWDEVRKLYLSLLEQGVPRNGSFDPSIWDLIRRFQQSPLGDFTTTYTITDGECSDSVELTITVVPGFSDPVCNLDAGEDNMLVMTRSEAAALPSWDEVRKLYLSLLERGVPRNGTFDPSIWDIIRKFNSTENNLGDYTVTYTITDGECSDSVELTVRVVED